MENIIEIKTTSIYELSEIVWEVDRVDSQAFNAERRVRLTFQIKTCDNSKPTSKQHKLRVKQHKQRPKQSKSRWKNDRVISDKDKDKDRVCNISIKAT